MAIRNHGLKCHFTPKGDDPLSPMLIDYPVLRCITIQKWCNHIKYTQRPYLIMGTKTSTIAS